MRGHLFALVALGLCARAFANGEYEFCQKSGKCKTACNKPALCYTQGGAQNANCSGFLHVAGLFPTTGQLCFHGLQASYAAQQAVNDINIKSGSADTKWVHKDLLENFCFVMHHNDTAGDAGIGLYHADSFLDINKNSAWTNYAHIDLFIGALSSEVTKAVQHLLQHNRLPQITYGATSPVLSNKKLYPTVVRTLPSDELLMDGVKLFFEKMEWDMISILAVNLEFGQAGATLLSRNLAGLAHKIEVRNNLLFTSGSHEVIENQLDVIKASESRVVFLHCSVADAAIVMTVAKKMGMLKKGYVWIGTEWAQDSIFEEFEVMIEPLTKGAMMTKAQAMDLSEEMAGMIAIRPLHNAENDIGAHIVKEIRGGVFNSTGSKKCIDTAKRAHVSTYAYFAYDAVLLAAHALTLAVSNGECNKNITSTSGKTITNHGCRNFSATMDDLRSLETAGKTKFEDVATATGSIKINSKGDRIMDFEVMNLRGEGEWHRVGTYQPVTLKIDIFMENITSPKEDTIVWAGGMTQIPSDRVESHVSLEALYLFFFLSTIVLSICVGNFLHSHEFYALPESGATIIFGAILGGVLKLMAHAIHGTHELIKMTEFDVEMFTLVLLPIIIFAAGFNLKKRDFFRNTTPILMTAFIGTTISTAIVGLGIYQAGTMDLFTFKSTKLSLIESLAYGALVSAVDPVATLAVFGALGVETDLNMRVFGESVLNDGVSIVLFRVFCKFITEEVNTMSIAMGFGKFFYICGFSVVTGMLVAAWLSLMLKHGNLHSYILEASMVLLASYVSFAAAEAMHQSGIIASLFCGIAMNHWTCVLPSLPAHLPRLLRALATCDCKHSNSAVLTDSVLQVPQLLIRRRGAVAARREDVLTDGRHRHLRPGGLECGCEPREPRLGPHRYHAGPLLDRPYPEHHAVGRPLQPLRQARPWHSLQAPDRDGPFRSPRRDCLRARTGVPVAAPSHRNQLLHVGGAVHGVRARWHHAQHAERHGRVHGLRVQRRGHDQGEQALQGARRLLPAHGPHQDSSFFDVAL